MIKGSKMTIEQKSRVSIGTKRGQSLMTLAEVEKMKEGISTALSGDNNPMKRKDVAAKVTESKRLKGDHARSSRRMILKNPMKNSATAKKVRNSLVDHYIANPNSVVKRESAKYLSGYFLSMKNGKMMYYRSSYELKRFKQLEEDEELLRYEYEEKAIPYLDEKGEQRVTIVDVTKYFKDGSIVLEEIKAKWAIASNFGNANLKIEAVREFAKKNNMGFSLVTEKELNIKL